MTRRRMRPRAAVLAVAAVAVTGVGATAPGAGASGPVAAAAATASGLNRCPAPASVVRSHAPGRGRTVALTFDDGPGPSTAPILSVLAGAGVPATFFNVGDQLAGHVRQLRREVRLGEAVGNHTWDHPDMTTLSPQAQARELDRTTQAIEDLAGVRPCLFRPPYGAYDASTLKLAFDRLLGVWTWSVDTQDWMASGVRSSYWVRRIVRRAAAGLQQRHPVVLLHNALGGDPSTVAALPQIIDRYRDAGYRFVRLR